jgi:hypothetical protein
MRFVIILILSLLSYTSVQSEEIVQQPVPPITGDAENSHPRKEDSNTNKNIAPPSHVPIMTNVYAAKKQDTKIGNKQDRGNAEPSKWTDPLVILTLFLVLATTGLVIIGYWQWRIYEATLSTTKAIQRAYIHFEHPRLSQEVIKLSQMTEGANATCYFHNFGLTQGTLTTGYTKTEISKDTPKIPDYTNYPNTWSGTETIPPRGEAVFPESIRLNSTEIEAINKGELLFFYGYFTYQDIFDEKREIAFFVQYDPNKERFFKVHRPGYNFST